MSRSIRVRQVMPAAFLALVASLTLGACSEIPVTPQAVVYVEVSVPGASPESLEQAVAKPIEQSIRQLAAVRSVRSAIVRGVVRTEVEYPKRPTPEQVMQVRTAVDAVSRKSGVSSTLVDVSVRPPAQP